MHALLDQNAFLVEEEATPLEPEFGFIVRAPDSGAVLWTGRDRPASRLTRIFRYSEYKRITPFDLQMRDAAGNLVVRLARGVPVFASRVRVYDAEQALIGCLRQRPLSLRGHFDVLDATARPLCSLRGTLTRSEFRLLTPDGVELARISKQWAGLGKELFTSADHYRLDIAAAVPADLILRQLILAAAIAIGLVVKMELP
jgi:uncharacterized protein YxjI